MSIFKLVAFRPLKSGLWGGVRAAEQITPEVGRPFCFLNETLLKGFLNVVDGH